jgi:hypothetical protein
MKDFIEYLIAGAFGLLIAALSLSVLAEKIK